MDRKSHRVRMSLKGRQTINYRVAVETGSLMVLTSMHTEILRTIMTKQKGESKICALVITG